MQRRPAGGAPGPAGARRLDPAAPVFIRCGDVAAMIRFVFARDDSGGDPATQSGILNVNGREIGLDCLNLEAEPPR